MSTAMAVDPPSDLANDLQEAAPSSGEVTGVIRPPPDIRAIVDKTALFVARNGKQFEARIQASAEGQSQKFAFMRPNDPYNAYYEFKIREVRSRRPAVLRCLHAIDATRVHLTMKWVVSFPILRPFGPSRATMMLRAGGRKRRRAEGRREAQGRSTGSDGGQGRRLYGI